MINRDVICFEFARQQHRPINPSVLEALVDGMALLLYVLPTRVGILIWYQACSQRGKFEFGNMTIHMRLIVNWDRL